jgi:diguanylate cyclase (GGDEF)-like protein
MTFVRAFVGAVTRRFSVASAILLFLVAVCGLIIALEASRILTQRDEALEDGKTDLANLAMSLTQHADQTFRGADAVLAGLVARLETYDRQDGDGVKRMTRWFRDEIERLPQLLAYSVTDERGIIFISSWIEKPNVDISDRDFFRIHVDNDDRAMFIGPPVFGRILGRWVIPISRRYNKADGSFGGIVSAFVELAFFQKFYDQMQIGTSGSILLLSSDEKLLVRRPFVEENIGRDMSQSNIAKALKHAPVDTVELTATMDGIVRINSYRRSEVYPLVVAVAQSTEEILAPWRRRTFHEISETAIILFTIILAGHLVRQMTRRLATNAVELAQANRRFDAAINNMAQGLCLYDADRKIVISNRKYAEIYDLDPDQVRPGTSLREVFQLRRLRGTNFARPEVEDIGNQQGQRVQELANGRIVSIVRQPMSEGGWLSTHEDITERRRNEKQIAYLAEHDPLTDIPNRASLLRTLDRLTSADEQTAVFLLDLDKFKGINDTLGHAAGDQLLQEVAGRLKSEIRDGDVVARLGGDEFAIVQRLGRDSHDNAVSLALRLIDVVTRPYELDGIPARVGVSIGIARSPDQGRDSADLLKKADLALYAVKSEGRNGFRIYDADMSRIAESQKLLEEEFRKALDRKEFELFYQPILDIATQAICGAEALVRWNHPQRGVIPPDEFIPLAEETGLIMPLGEWILRQACKEAATWPEHFKLSVNLSVYQFKKGDLLDLVFGAVMKSGLSPERLELEITETALLESQAEYLLILRQLRNMGITIVLDDFGTGYSSASYLTRFPFDKIKIDKSFVDGMSTRRECAAVIASILALARGLDIAVTAEGVETQEQLRRLSAEGVNYAQGFLVGHPLPLAGFLAENWMRSAQSVA